MSRRVMQLLANLNRKSARFNQRFEVRDGMLIKYKVTNRGMKEECVRDIGDEASVFNAILGEIQFVSQLR